MPFTKESAKIIGATGGKQSSANRIAKRQKMEELLVKMSGEFSDGYKEKMVALANGAEITKPEQEFMDRFEKWPEFVIPKLSRAEVTGKDGKDLPQPILFNALPSNNSDSQGKRDEGKN